MKKNMGAIDRGVRLIVAIALTILLAARVFSGVTAIVLGIVAILLLATSLVGCCLLYVPLRVNTNKKGQA